MDTTVSGDGSVTVRGVPFPTGEPVEVIVLPRQRPADESHTPLRSTVRQYERPFETAADADAWDVT